MPSMLASSSSSSRPQHESPQGRASSSMDRRRPSTDAVYVSARSDTQRKLTFAPCLLYMLPSVLADALLSDHRATTLLPQCLDYVNALLDELLSNILQRSLGLSTDKLKTNGISTIIPPPLGRDAVGEAELELLSWLDSEEGRVWKGVTETRYVSSSAEGGQVWPWRAAWELMRVMTQSYSTLGDRPSSEALEKSYIAALKAQGGDVRPGIVDPAALYLTAVIEHVAEHILQSLSAVMGQMQNLSAAGPQELHSALCEDEALYGMVKGMRILPTIERAMQTTRKSSLPSSSISSHKSRASTSNPPPTTTARPSTVYTSASTSHPSDFGTFSSTNPPSGYRSSLDSHSSAGPISPPTSTSKQSFSLGRKSTSSQRNGSSATVEPRGSLHTMDTADRVIVEDGDDGAMNDDEKDFDEFLRGGATMKLSLTPQSLKTTDSYEPTASRRQNSVARRPPPPIESSVPARSMSTSSRGAVSLSSSLRESAPKPLVGGGLRLAAREPTARLDEDDEDEDEDNIMMRGGRRAPRKESLVELLSSDPPWSDKSGSSSPARAREPSVPRSVPLSPAAPTSLRSSPNPNTITKSASFRGADSRSASSNGAGGFTTPPIRASPSMPAYSKFESLSGQAAGATINRPVPRSPKDHESSDSDDELLGRKKKAPPLRSADLIALLDGPPPSSMNSSSIPSSPSQQTLDSAGPKPKKSGMFKGFVSKLTGSGTGSASKASNADDLLPPAPPSSYNSSSLRSNKSSNGQQPSSSKPGPSVRRSKSSSSFSEQKTSAPFVANISEPLPPTKDFAFASSPSRVRSKSSTSREQAFATDQGPPPPLPTSIPNFADRIPRSSSTSQNGFVPPPPPAKVPQPRSNGASLPPPSTTRDGEPFLANPPRRSTSTSSSTDVAQPIRPPRGARPVPGSRDVPVAVAAAAPTGLFAEAPSAHALDVSPALSETPSFGFPSRLRTAPTSEGFGKVDEVRLDGFSPLGLPLDSRESKRVQEADATGLPTPVASPPPTTVDEDAYEPTPVPAVIDEEPEAEAAQVQVPAPSHSAVDPVTPSPTVSEPVTIPRPPTSDLGAPHSSVPHTSLIHLRDLIAHASTADECRLLVNSLLAQWNVPFLAVSESGGDDVARARLREEQVGRVHGWLLEESSRADKETTAARIQEDEAAAEETPLQEQEVQEAKVAGALLGEEEDGEDGEFVDAVEQNGRSVGEDLSRE